MKKVITVCLCLILALSTLIAACAEDFTIHAGTMFGDTIEQVKEKETLEFDFETEVELGYHGKVAGYEPSFIYYYFNSKGLLYDVEYVMPDSSVIGFDGVSSECKELQSSLTEKYGEPLTTDDEAYNLMFGHRINEMIQKNQEFEDMGYGEFKTNVDKYIAWSIPYDGYNVKIELMILSGRDSSKNYADCIIDYHTYTDEELEIAKREYAEVKKTNIDDL